MLQQQHVKFLLLQKSPETIKKREGRDREKKKKTFTILPQSAYLLLL